MILNMRSFTITLDVRLRLQKSRARLGKAFLPPALLLVCLLAGCSLPPVRLMPTPVTFSNGDVDPFEEIGVELQTTEIPVLYVTNRGLFGHADKPIHTILPGNKLCMGVAHVRVGDETLDWETLHRLSTSADPDERPIVHLDWLEQLAKMSPTDKARDSPEARAFFRIINEALAASPNTELLVYVHGSNNTMPRAAAQAAQFRHFTGRRMVVLAFMWPSTGTFLRYFTDVRNAAASVEPFARLIELLAENTTASKIDVLAYSAGAQVASPALAHLGREARPGESRAALRKRLRLGQIYYAAPDMDTRRAANDLTAYIDLVERVSLAANLNDSVLRWAALAGRASRAGRPNISELSADQSQFLIDASRRLKFDLIKVDPNDIPGLPVKSHAFWYDDPWVSGDLLAQFLFNTPPPQRGLDARYAGNGTLYWKFPPDFSDRIVRIVKITLKAVSKADPASAAPPQ